MRKKLFGISFILVVTIVALSVVLFAGQPAGAAPLSQTDITTTAVAFAQRVGLQGQPTSVIAKQMTTAEFNARLDPFSNEDHQDTQVWLVVMKGNVVHVNPRGPQGEISQTGYNNIWVLLTIDGQVTGWGSQSAGNELNLSVPANPLTKWPAPVNPNK